MGDRANVKCNGIYMYTHWGGSKLPAVVQTALERGKSRWNDEAYLNRIIFSEMIVNDVEGSTGYGLSLEVQDGDDRVIEVDCKTQTVRLNGVTYSFSEYCDKHEPSWIGEVW